MHPSDAQNKEICENDRILVHSVNGQEACFKVRISEQVRAGELYAPIHYVECNKLTPSIYDPYSKEPSYKSTPVWFEKGDGTGETALQNDRDGRDAMESKGGNRHVQD